MATNYSQDVQSASTIMQRAVEQAERYLADAEAEAARILTDARDQKASIEAHARKEAAETLAQAQQEAAAITAAATERVADREAKVFAAEAMVEEKATLILTEAIRRSSEVHESAARAAAYQQDILTRLVELFSQEGAAITKVLDAAPALSTPSSVDVEQFVKDVRDLLQDRVTPAIEPVPAEDARDTDDVEEDVAPSPAASKSVVLASTETPESAR